MLGGFATAGLGRNTLTRGDSIITTAEPDAPDHIPRRRVKVLDTEISYVDSRGYGCLIIDTLADDEAAT